MRNKLVLFAALAFAAPLRAQELPEPPPTASRYTPSSRAFSCEVPSGWTAFDEEEGGGTAVHLLGPDNPAGVFRAGIDIRYMERGQPGFKTFRQFVDDVRRSDDMTQRSATNLRPLRINAGLARVFEISETRRVPADRLPSVEEALHRYVGIIPSGDSYYVISLASTRDAYLDFKDLFTDFLRTFRPMGAR